MSDPVIQSQLQNPLLRSLRQAFTTNLSYNVTENYPAVSKQLIAVSSNISIPSGTAWPASQEVVFNIPKTGFMDSLLIQTSFKASSPNSTTTTRFNHTQPGEHIFERIELLAQNRVLAVQTYASLITHIAGLKTNQHIAVRHRTTLRNANTGVEFQFPVTPDEKGDASTYTPFFSGLLGNIRNAVDLTKVQDLQLRCYVRSSQNFFNPGGNDPSGIPTLSDFKFTLYMNSHVIDQEKYIELRQQNLKENSLLNIISYDYFTEEFDVSGAGDHSLQLRCNGAVSETAVFTQDSLTSNHEWVRKISFRANGMSLLENIPVDVMSFEGDFTGAGLNFKKYDPLPENTYEIYESPVTRICWGLVPGSVYNSGLINFKGLANPTLVVTTDSASKIYVVHKIFTVITISSDGSISLTSTV